MSKPTDVPYWVNNKTAQALWEAYLRMMEGNPKHVHPTARLTLSSVAVEAGFQRSTLSRRRYPDLAELIEQNAAKKPGQTMRTLYEKKRKANANLRDKLRVQADERGALLNKLAELERRHIVMSAELDHLKGARHNERVVSFDRSDSNE